MEKHKFRINWFDILCLVLCIAAVGCAVWAFVWSGRQQGTPEGTEVKIRYVVEITDIREEIAECVSVGDRVYLKDENGGVWDVGVISGIQRESCLYKSPTKTRVVSADGVQRTEPVTSVKAGRVNVLISVETPAVLNADNRYYVGSVRMNAGMRAELLTRHFTGAGYVISLEEEG